MLYINRVNLDLSIMQQHSMRVFFVITISILVALITVFTSEPQAFKDTLIFVGIDVIDEDFEIFSMHSDGSAAINLTNNDSHELYAVLSPDGNHIVYVSNRTGNEELFTMNIDGSASTQLTSNSVFNVDPSWSPDGSQIAYLSLGNRSTDIFIMNSDGTGVTNITNSIAPEKYPIWSPVSHQIAFISNRNGFNEIYSIYSDGTDYRQLTNFVSQDTSLQLLSWSPDGAFISFTGPHLDIYRINADGSELFKISDEPEWNAIIWLSNNQILYKTPVYGYVAINIDGSDRTVTSLNWPDNAVTFSRPLHWQAPIIVPNMPPIANAGIDQTIVITDKNSASVELNGTDSFDPDGDIYNSVWYENTRVLATGENARIVLSVGLHTLTLMVTDNHHIESSDTVIVNVVKTSIRESG